MIRASSFKSFKPTIIFVHHYGGDAESTRRYQDFVSNLGFDCYAFTLGTPKDWPAQLAGVMNEVRGSKILFTLSFPSYLAAQYLAEHGSDEITAWVCDGGPFADLWKCSLNYYTYAEPAPSHLSRLMHAAIGYFYLGGRGYVANIKRWLKTIDPKLPILSVRAGADLLVPEHAIDKFFSYGRELNLKRLVIPQVHHLEGLRRNPELYKQHVGEFLSSVAEPSA
jgi:pimeloyl-ACP methyl ester carboxylesterase